MKWNAWPSFVLLLLVVLAGTGCGSLVASGDIRESRIRLNDSIQDTTEKQILLALVQTRFVRGPSYLNITAINSQLRWDAGISGNWMTQGSSAASPSISYSEQPTITYVPLTGTQYVTQIMAPFKLKTLLLFLSAGWTIGDVFSVVVQRIGPDSNGPIGNPNTSADLSFDVKQFRRMMTLLTDLQLQDKLALSTLADNNWPTTKWSLQGTNITEYQYGAIAQMPLAMNFTQSLLDPSDPDYANFMELLSLLNLDPEKLVNTNSMYPNRLTILLSSSAFPVPLPSLKIQTRSFHQMLWNLSFAVNVPPLYEDEGWVYVPKNEDGSKKNMNKVYNGILNVQYSRTRPENAAIEIEYDGYWYFVANNDLASKTTFVLLGQMVQMQASPTNSIPNLTLNAG